MTSTEEGRPAPRPTRQRRAVAEVMRTFTDFRSAREIHEMLVGRGEAVGLATVYRTLQLLADARRGRRAALARRARRSTGPARAPITTTWSAASCGATVEVEGPTVERWTSAVAGDHGFTDISHTLEIFGTCPDCR